MHFSKIIHHFPGYNPQQNKFVRTKYKLLIVIYLLFTETSLNTSFGFLIRYWSTTSIPALSIPWNWPIAIATWLCFIQLPAAPPRLFTAPWKQVCRNPSFWIPWKPANPWKGRKQTPTWAVQGWTEPTRRKNLLEAFSSPCIRVRKGCRSESRFLLIHH